MLVSMVVLRSILGCPSVDPPNRTVLLPNPDDCSSFFMCSNGVPILQKCPEGLFFNPYLNVCDFPQNVNTDDCYAGFGGGEEPQGFEEVPFNDPYILVYDEGLL